MAVQKTKYFLMDFALPIAFLLILTFIFWATNADLLLARRFYSPIKGWPWKNTRPWIDLYNYGNIPPLMLALCGFVIFVFSFLFRELAYFFTS